MQIFIRWLLEVLEGVFYDVDDTLIASEPLQLRTWIMSLTVHCRRESATASEGANFKMKTLEEFVRWVFHAGTFNVMFDGFILFLRSVQ